MSYVRRRVIGLIVLLSLVLSTQSAVAASSEVSDRPKCTAVTSASLGIEDANEKQSVETVEEDNKVDGGKSWIEVIGIVLGSGGVSAIVSCLLDKRKYKNLAILSKADALYSAFISQFSGDFLSRDDSSFTLFQKKIEQFCIDQKSLITYLEMQKNCDEFVEVFNFEKLTSRFNGRKEGTKEGEREREIREEIGRAHGKLTSRLM